MIVSSRSNRAIREMRALRHRKERDESGLFFVEGIRIVAEAVDTGAAMDRCVIAPRLLTSEFARTLVERVRAAGVPCVEVTPDVFRSLALRENPQGVAAVVYQRWYALRDVRPDAALCWTALDAVQDPGNLGTILRTSDAVGGGGVALVGATTDPYDPAAVRASMGAIFSQRLARTDLDELASWKTAGGWHVVGTSDSAATDYQAARYDAPLLLFMGSEREGLSTDQQRLCDEMVRIPMVGRSDSLNLAVATAVTLYEIFNRRRAGPR